MLFHSIQGAGGSSTAGQQEVVFTASGSWVVPSGVTSVSAVCVGAGGGGSESASGGSGGSGGDLRYYNNLAVTPGETLTITTGLGGLPGSTGVAGPFTRIARGATVLLEAAGGGGGTTSGSGAKNGTSTTIGGSVGGGDGGTCANPAATECGGGGGAGGYSGNGGDGGSGASISGTNGAGGGGGGGGGGGDSDAAGSGGGVSAFGLGPNGVGGNGNIVDGASATGGSYGDGALGPNAVTGADPGGVSNNYGAGGGGADNITEGSRGGAGFVRIVWPGSSRSFPSTDVWMSRVLTTVIETQSSANTITIPGSAAVGDLAVLSNMSETTGTQSDPSGWTRIVNQQANLPVLTCWYRIIQSGDAGATVTMTTGTAQSAEMILFRKSSGVVSSVSVSGATIVYSATAQASQTQTVSTPNSIVFGVFASDSSQIVSGDMEFDDGVTVAGASEPSAVFTGENGDTSRQLFMRFRIYDVPPPANVLVDNTRSIAVQTMASFTIGVS